MISPLMICCCFLASAMAMDNLKVAFQWKQVDFAFPSGQDRQEAISSGNYIPENNIPVGIEVYKERMFVTFPRWKAGVAASLAYLYLNESGIESPKLRPYPNWSAHDFNLNEDSELISPFRVRADRCGRLWALDSGFSDILGNFTVVSPPQLIVYDLNTDELLRRYKFPKNQVEEDSSFANIAVEDTSCEDTYAYSGDLGSPGLVVYSWRTKTSWRVKHHYFHPDPLSGDYTVSGINFQWDDALFGLGLSAAGADGFSTLYFHPMSSTHEFSVSTKVLRDEALSKNSFFQFKHLGSRGPNAQSSVEFVDKDTGVLFYALVNLNAIACWRTTNKAYTIESQGRIFMSNTTMVFPNDIKVDYNGNLWVMSNRLPQFLYSKLSSDEVNYRILMAPVKDAIRGTACDTSVNIDLIKKLADSTLTKLKNLATSNASTGIIAPGALHFIFVLLVTMFALKR